MARTANKEEYAAKRNQIVDATQRLVYAKGHKRMTIRDVLSDLGMSRGAFHRDSGSKPAVLETLIDRMRQELERSLLPIAHHPHVPARETPAVHRHS